MIRCLLPALLTGVVVLAGCGGQDPTALTGDSRCGELAALDPDARAQAVLRVSDEVGAASAGNPLWLGQIATYCTKLPDATLRAAFGRGDSQPDEDAGSGVVEGEAVGFTAERTYRWDTEGETGSTAKVQLALGSVVRPDEAVPEEFADLTGVCDVDSQRDAFLPIRITVQNTTDGFELSPSVTMRLANVEDRFQARVGVDAASSFSDGEQCDAMTDGSIDDGAGVSFDSIEPDGERDHDSLLVLHDFYSPSSPDGDEDALGEWFGSVSIRDETSTLRTECFDAPAGRYAFTGGFLRLGGALSPGVPLADRVVDRTPRSDNDPPRCADGDPANAPAGDEPATDAACHELNTGAKIVGTKTTLGAHLRTFDRASSLNQVCSGFGAPEGLTFTPGMQCAIVAAAATYAPLPPGVDASRTCDAVAIQQAYESGDWAGEAAGVACGYFGEAFAGGVGIVAAGAASPTGPGAVAVGLATYKALSAGMDLACGGLFDGGAEALGTKLEADHQRNVAMDIIREGKCLRETTFHGVIKWSAAPCP